MLFHVAKRGPLLVVACEDDVRITDAQEALARALVELTALAEIAMGRQPCVDCCDFACGFRQPLGPPPSESVLGDFCCFLGCFVVVNLSVVGVVRPRAAGRVRPSFPRLVTGIGPCYSFVAGYLN